MLIQTINFCPTPSRSTVSDHSKTTAIETIKLIIKIWKKIPGICKICKILVKNLVTNFKIGNLL